MPAPKPAKPPTAGAAPSANPLPAAPRAVVDSDALVSTASEGGVKEDEEEGDTSTASAGGVQSATI